MLLKKRELLFFEKSTNGPQSEKIKKTFQKMFRNRDLNIIIKYNMKTVNYLGVLLNLNDGSYRPHKKPNEETNYKHVNPPLHPIHFRTTSNVNRKTIIKIIEK